MIQEVNITYPAMVNLLLKVAFLVLELAKAIKTLSNARGPPLLITVPVTP